MTLLLISLSAPFLGPLLLLPLRHRPRVASATDGFVLVAMGGLVGLHALPESFAELGWPALLAAVAGLVLPKMAHGAHPPAPAGPGAAHAAQHGGGHAGGCHHDARPGWIGFFAATALLVHALADGVGLVPTHDAAHAAVGHAHHHGHEHAWLPFAVALHRLVEGTGLWWLLRGIRRTHLRWAALAALGLATLSGRLFGGLALTWGFAPAVALLQASVAGSLLHVLLWHAPALPGAGEAKPAGGLTAEAASACGGALACALLVALAAGEHVAWAPPATTLVPMARAGLGCGAGLAAAWLGHALACGRPAGGAWTCGRLRDAWAGAWAGLSQAACSCGVLPLAAGLRRSGASAAYVSAFVASAPAMGLVAWAISLALLGPKLTLLRAGGVVALAFLTGLAASGRAGAACVPTPRLAPCAKDAGTWRRRLADGAHFALGEVLDFTGPWLACGVALAWAIGFLVPAGALTLLTERGLDVPVLLALAAPLYLCPAASTLVAAALMAKGAGPGGALAFCWAASSLSPALWSTWRRGALHGTPLPYACVLLGGAWAGGRLVDGAAASAPVQAALSAWDIAQVGVTAQAGWTVGLGLVLLAATVGRAMWRQGVRGFSAQLASSNRTGRASAHHRLAEA